MHEALNALLEYGDIKVDQQPKPDTGQPQVGEQLCFMDRFQPRHRFDLDHYQAVDNFIHAIAAIQFHTFVFKRQRHFSLNRDTL